MYWFLARSRALKPSCIHDEQELKMHSFFGCGTFQTHVGSNWFVCPRFHQNLNDIQSAALCRQMQRSVTPLGNKKYIRSRTKFVHSQFKQIKVTLFWMLSFAPILTSMHTLGTCPFHVAYINAVQPSCRKQQSMNDIISFWSNEWIVKSTHSILLIHRFHIALYMV